MSRRRVRAMAVGGALCLLLGACGSSSKTAAKTPATTAATSGGTSATTSAPAGSTGGGGAANPALSPVTVGLDNLESSSLSYASVRIGFDQGVAYVNSVLGGINGHPMKVDACKVDLSPASTVSCANQFVQQHVVANMQGVDINAPSLIPILTGAGIPIIVPAAQSPQFNLDAGETYSVLPSAFEFTVDTITAMQKGGSKTVALIAPLGTPGYSQYVALANKVAAKLGVKINVVNLPTTVSDYTAFAATILATHPDAVDMPTAADDVCDGLLPALRNSGFTGTVFLSSCTHFSQILPKAQLTNAEAFVAAWLDPLAAAAPARAKTDIAIYDTWMAKQHEITPAHYDIAWYGFQTAVTGAEMLRHVKGTVTAASFKSALPTATGEVFLTGLPFNCASGFGWPGTTSCSKGVPIAQWTTSGVVQAPWSPADPTPYYPLTSKG